MTTIPSSVEAGEIIRDLLTLCGDADRYVGDRAKVERARAFLSTLIPEDGVTVPAIERARQIAIKHALPGRYSGASTHATLRGDMDEAPYMLAIVDALSAAPKAPPVLQPQGVERGVWDRVLHVLNAAANYATAEANGGEFAEQHRADLASMNGDVIADDARILAAALSPSGATEQGDGK